MKKIPTIFARDMTRQPALVVDEWTPGCEWVRDGEGVATRKWDGTACMVRTGRLYKRYEIRGGKTAPDGFEPTGEPGPTGKQAGWVHVGDGPNDKWHREAWEASPHFHERDGTYELCGPKVQGNPERYLGSHVLIPHGTCVRNECPRTFTKLREWLASAYIEGLVWHHPDGRMAKIKGRDFGIRRPETSAQ